MGGGASKNQVAPSDAASTTKLNETLQQLAAERDSHSSLQVRTHGSWLLPSHVERRGEAHVRQTDQPTFLSPLCHRGNSAAVASGFCRAVREAGHRVADWAQGEIVKIGDCVYPSTVCHRRMRGKTEARIRYLERRRCHACTPMQVLVLLGCV
jgi:hypothetical protein